MRSPGTDLRAMAFAEQGQSLGEFENIILKRDGGVAVLILNRPHVLNALSNSTHTEIFEALHITRDTPELRVLVLTGAGRGFCSGDDMKEADPRIIPWEKEVDVAWHNIVREMRALPQPIIAAVNGVAVGAGSGLVLGSDIRIASEEARFGDIFIQRGIAGGAYLLTQTVGPAKARELIFTGDIVDAETALKLGIFNHVVPKDELESTVMTLARRLADGPAQALALSKAAIDQVMGMGLDEGLRTEEIAKLKSLKTQEVQEGVTAFVDKRPVDFNA